MPCQEAWVSVFLPSQRHAMPEVPLHAEPGKARIGGEVFHLCRCQRPSDRQGTVVVEDGMKRAGEEPRPQVGTSRSHEIVDDNAAGRESIKGPKRGDDLGIRRGVEEKAA